MSVIIRDMDLPENCCSCQFEAHNFCFLWKIKGELKDAEDWFPNRPDYCPLADPVASE